jgi:hypothetical protein
MKPKEWLTESRAPVPHSVGISEGDDLTIGNSREDMKEFVLEQGVVDNLRNASEWGFFDLNSDTVRGGGCSKWNPSAGDEARIDGKGVKAKRLKCQRLIYTVHNAVR